MNLKMNSFVASFMLIGIFTFFSCYLTAVYLHSQGKLFVSDEQEVDPKKENDNKNNNKKQTLFTKVFDTISNQLTHVKNWFSGVVEDFGNLKASTKEANLVNSVILKIKRAFKIILRAESVPILPIHESMKTGGLEYMALQRYNNNRGWFGLVFQFGLMKLRADYLEALVAAQTFKRLLETQQAQNSTLLKDKTKLQQYIKTSKINFKTQDKFQLTLAAHEETIVKLNLSNQKINELNVSLQSSNAVLRQDNSKFRAVNDAQANRIADLDRKLLTVNGGRLELQEKVLDLMDENKQLCTELDEQEEKGAFENKHLLESNLGLQNQVKVNKQQHKKELEHKDSIIRKLEKSNAELRDNTKNLSEELTKSTSTIKEVNEELSELRVSNDNLVKELSNKDSVIKQAEEDKSKILFESLELKKINNNMSEELINMTSSYQEVTQTVSLLKENNNKLVTEIVQQAEDEKSKLLFENSELKKVNNKLSEEINNNKFISELLQHAEEDKSKILFENSELKKINNKLSEDLHNKTLTIQKVSQELSVSRDNNNKLIEESDNKTLLIKRTEEDKSKILFESSELKKIYNKISEDLNNKTSIIEEVTQQYTKLEDNNNTLLQELNVKSSTIREINDQVSLIQQNNNTLSKELEGKTSALKQAEDEKSKVVFENSYLKTVNNKLSEELDTKSTVLKQFTQQISQLEDNNNSLLQECNNKNSTSQKANVELCQLKETITDLNKDLKKKSSLIKELEDTNSKFIVDNSKLKENNTKLISELDTVFENMSSKLAEAEESNGKAVEENKRFKLSVDQLSEIILQLQNQSAEDIEKINKHYATIIQELKDSNTETNNKYEQVIIEVETQKALSTQLQQQLVSAKAEEERLGKLVSEKEEAVKKMLDEIKVLNESNEAFTAVSNELKSQTDKLDSAESEILELRSEVLKGINERVSFETRIFKVQASKMLSDIKLKKMTVEKEELISSLEHHKKENTQLLHDKNVQITTLEEEIFDALQSSSGTSPLNIVGSSSPRALQSSSPRCLSSSVPKLSYFFEEEESNDDIDCQPQQWEEQQLPQQEEYEFGDNDANSVSVYEFYEDCFSVSYSGSLFTESETDNNSVTQSREQKEADQVDEDKRSSSSVYEYDAESHSGSIRGSYPSYGSNLNGTTLIDYQTLERNNHELEKENELLIIQMDKVKADCETAIAEMKLSLQDAKKNHKALQGKYREVKDELSEKSTKLSIQHSTYSSIKLREMQFSEYWEQLGFLEKPETSDTVYPDLEVLLKRWNIIKHQYKSGFLTHQMEFIFRSNDQSFQMLEIIPKAMYQSIQKYTKLYEAIHEYLTLPSYKIVDTVTPVMKATLMERKRGLTKRNDIEFLRLFVEPLSGDSTERIHLFNPFTQVKDDDSTEATTARVHFNSFNTYFNDITKDEDSNSDGPVTEVGSFESFGHDENEDPTFVSAPAASKKSPKEKFHSLIRRLSLRKKNSNNIVKT